MRSEWNHNIHYHELVLSAAPRPCARALDVGCGTGLLARKLAAHCGEVVGIDCDPPSVAQAAARALANLRVIEGKILAYPFAPTSFSLITAVATLHHLPLEAALLRFKELLAPGGVLAIVGLSRAQGLEYLLSGAAGRVASVALRQGRRFVKLDAPGQPPRETLAEIASLAKSILPGCVVRRRLLFRYSLLWTKPGGL